MKISKGRIFLYGAASVAAVFLFWYWREESAQISREAAQISRPYPALSEWARRAWRELAAEKEAGFAADAAAVAEFPGVEEALTYSPTEEEKAELRRINGPRLPEVETAYTPGEELRIGLINDFQAGASAKVFPGRPLRVVKPKYLKRINYFLERMYADFKPHFMISPGDIIEGTNRPTSTGAAELRAIKYLFDSRGNIPMYWGLGNHELRSVNEKQFLAAMGMESKRYTFDVGDYRVIVTGANYDELGRVPIPRHNFVRGNFAARELLWLERQLRQARAEGKIILVFSHQPPLSAVEGRSARGLPLHADEVEKLFSAYGVAAVFSGHIEKNFAKEVGGVKYFGTTGIKKSPNNLGTYAQITMNGRQPSVEIFYIDNATGEYVGEKLEIAK